mgnify:CR=1 FL=1
MKHTVNVVASTGGSVSTTPKLEIKMYPVPTNNELTVELDAIKNYKISIFNSLGQNVNLHPTIIALNKVTFNTQGLSDGIYFVQFRNNEIKESRKITVTH